MIHTALLALIACLMLSGPAAAQSQRTASCAGFEALIGIIDLTSTLLTADLRTRTQEVSRLSRAVGQIDRTTLQNRLARAGHAAHQGDVRHYLNELSQFIAINRTNGPAYGSWILGKQSFQTKHAKLRVLGDSLCQAADPQTRQLGTDETAKSSLQMARIKLTNSLAAFTIHKETQMLMQVFALLATCIAALFALNHLAKLLRAIRLDRYACAIPSVIFTERHEITGHINVLGNRGLSFEVFDLSDPTCEEALKLGVQVTFQTETSEFKAILTKPYDGTAGFRLTVPMKKHMVQSLLEHSQIKPHRKLEITRDAQTKKPARPSGAALALKSRNSPAE